MRKWLNGIRASRDKVRNAISRRRYDCQRPPVQTPSSLKRVVFVRWDAKWGDSLVFSFVPKAFKAIDPTISVEVITTPEMASLFRDVFAVDAVHETQRRPSKSMMRHLAERVGKVDLVVYFSHQAKHREMFLLSQLQASHIASLDDSVGRVDLKLGEVTRGQHFAEKYVTLLQRCGASNIDTRYIVPRVEESEARVTNLITARGRPFVCINAYSKGRARSLTRETTDVLIQKLLVMLPKHDICVLSAPGKQEEVESICQTSAPGRVFCLPSTDRIHDNIALIARADALVSGITATVHMADGLDVPSFVLFPYDPADRDDWHSRHPLSVNWLAEPSDPLDVNQLDWAGMEAALAAFCKAMQAHAAKGLLHYE